MWRSALVFCACLAAVFVRQGGDLAFLVHPNPPSASEDAFVLIFRPDGARTYYRVGNGPWKRGVPKDRKFVIPQRELKEGQNLYVLQRGIGAKGAVCVEILR